MEQSELLRYLVDLLEKLGATYLVTGSLATTAFGEPRFTHDIDVVVDLRPEHVDAFCAAFPAPGFYLNRQAVENAVSQRHQFDIIQPDTGLKVDVIMATDSDFDRSRLARGIRLPSVGNREVCFASPEDVIIKKMEYFKEGGSDKHLRDILGVLKVRGAMLDRNYVTKWAADLGLVDIWEEILGQAAAS